MFIIMISSSSSSSSSSSNPLFSPLLHKNIQKKIRRDITMNTIETGWDRVYVSPMAKRKLMSIFFSQQMLEKGHWVAQLVEALL